MRGSADGSRWDLLQFVFWTLFVSTKIENNAFSQELGLTTEVRV
jgi:hypothetical protein